MGNVWNIGGYVVNNNTSKRIENNVRHTSNILLKRLEYIQSKVIPYDTTNLNDVFRYPNIFHLNVLEVDKVIVGYLVWKTISNIKAYLCSLAVLSQHQNKGYGSKLLNFSIEQILKYGLTEIEVSALRTNNKAIRFYLKHNFQIQSSDNSTLTLEHQKHERGE